MQQALANAPDNPLIFEAITQLADKALPSALKAQEMLIAQLANETVSITGILDPSAIVFGGDLSGHQALVEKHRMPAVHARLKKKLRNGAALPRIRLSAFGSQAVAAGAAALVYQAVINGN